MKRPRTHAARRGQVLILLAGWLFFGGSASIVALEFFTGRTASSVHKALKSAVEDKERRGEARAVVGEWEEQAEEFIERSIRRRSKLLEALKGHDTSRGSVDALFAGQDAATDRVLMEALDRRFELRAQLTAKEWRAVFPAVAGR